MFLSFSGLFRYYLILSISSYIMYSNQAEASPIPGDEVDKVNFLNLQCDISSDKSRNTKASMSDSELRERLVAVLISCNSALHITKHLTDNYVSFHQKHSLEKCFLDTSQNSLKMFWKLNEPKLERKKLKLNFKNIWSSKQKHVAKDCSEVFSCFFEEFKMFQRTCNQSFILQENIQVQFLMLFFYRAAHKCRKASFKFQASTL